MIYGRCVHLSQREEMIIIVRTHPGDHDDVGWGWYPFVVVVSCRSLSTTQTRMLDIKEYFIWSQNMLKDLQQQL